MWSIFEAKPYDLFDRILEAVSELGFKIESIRSADCEGEFNYEFDDGRNIHLSVRRYKSEPEKIGFFTYLIWSDHNKYKAMNKDTGLYDLGVNLQAVEKDMSADKYVPLD